MFEILSSPLWDVVATVLTAIFTGVLTWIGIRQHNDRVALQRAYVSVVPMGFRRSNTDPTRGTATFKIENAGNLPAHKISFSAKLEIGGNDFRPDLNSTEFDEAGDLVAR